MPNRVADIIVACKLFKTAVAKRLSRNVEPAPDLSRFTDAMDAIVLASGSDVIAQHCWLELPANRPPWVATEIDVTVGDDVSYFLQGRIYASRFLDIWLNPSGSVWCKVGDRGEVFRGTRNSHSFTAECAGRLQFGNYFPNDWETPQGQTKRSDDEYGQVAGDSKILVIKWNVAPLDGLRSLIEIDDFEDCLKTEIQRLERGVTTPLGWQYLWNLGPADIYRDGKNQNGNPCIHCNTHEDVGILQYQVDLPLGPNTNIRWRWLVEQLPSEIREDSMPSHDYLSIAVEFENGRNLSYYWSKTLPEGYGYDCPIPSWQGKEYHIVIRSGTDGIGMWLDEERNIYHDYQHYIGRPPVKIIKIWLIANSIFQRKKGVCTYSDIALSQAGKEIEIL